MKKQKIKKDLRLDAKVCFFKRAVQTVYLAS